MRVDAIELRRVRMPLVSPFRTSFGTQTERDILVLRAVTDGPDGWGECVALTEPVYSSEYVAGVIDVLRMHLIPALRGVTDARETADALAFVKGHRMAKGALEMALLDAQLRAEDRSLAQELGAVHTRVPCGVSVGIMDSVPQLVDAVAAFVDAGYVRVKLKIEPGWDIEPVRAVRARFPDIPLQVDANTAYRPADIPHLTRLDAEDLLLIEQPFDEEDLLGHVQLAAAMRTPVCLDETITSAATAEQAIRLKATRILNIKAGRVGGYLEARRIHDLCLGQGVPVWCGGMVETGLGRAANIALAALPGFTLPGDVSASDRFYAVDLTEPFVMADGHLDVPTGPGLGVTPLPDVLDDLTTWSDTVPVQGIPAAG